MNVTVDRFTRYLRPEPLERPKRYPVRTVRSCDMFNVLYYNIFTRTRFTCRVNVLGRGYVVRCRGGLYRQSRFIFRTVIKMLFRFLQIIRWRLRPRYGEEANPNVPTCFCFDKEGRIRNLDGRKKSLGGYPPYRLPTGNDRHW